MSLCACGFGLRVFVFLVGFDLLCGLLETVV